MNDLRKAILATRFYNRDGASRGQDHDYSPEKSHEEPSSDKVFPTEPAFTNHPTLLREIHVEAFVVTVTAVRVSGTSSDGTEAESLTVDVEHNGAELLLRIRPPGFIAPRHDAGYLELPPNDERDDAAPASPPSPPPGSNTEFPTDELFPDPSSRSYPGDTPQKAAFEAVSTSTPGNTKTTRRISRGTGILAVLVLVVVAAVAAVVLWRYPIFDTTPPLPAAAPPAAPPAPSASPAALTPLPDALPVPPTSAPSDPAPAVEPVPAPAVEAVSPSVEPATPVPAKTGPVKQPPKAPVVQAPALVKPVAVTPPSPPAPPVSNKPAVAKEDAKPASVPPRTVHEQSTLSLRQLVSPADGKWIAWFADATGKEAPFREGDRLPNGDTIKRIDNVKGAVTVTSPDGVTTTFFVGK